MTKFKNGKSYLTVIFLLVISATLLFPQHASFNFERISIEDGLSNNSINQILQTKDGFLWIATKDGLNRYDGKTFKIFKHSASDSLSIPENYVMCLLEDKKNNLWVGTWGGGLCRYDSQNEYFVSYNTKVTSIIIYKQFTRKMKIHFGWALMIKD